MTGEVADDMKRKSLHLVRIMVESDFHATRLGSMLYELSGSLDKEPQIQRAIELTFAKKAPATLHKRTLAFWKLFKFHSDRGHKSGLHMSEASIFAYFESLTRGAATAPQSCLEALFFMHALLGLRVPIDAHWARPHVCPRALRPGGGGWGCGGHLWSQNFKKVSCLSFRNVRFSDRFECLASHSFRCLG